MKYMKISIVLQALLLAAMVIVPCVSAVEDNGLQDAVNVFSSEKMQRVDISEAQSIASANVKLMADQGDEFADWNAASVQYSTSYFDLDNQITAYSFDVIVDGKYDGYILTSATTQNYPELTQCKKQTRCARP